MKKHLCLALTVICTVSMAQVPDNFRDVLPSQPVVLDAEHPLEIQIVSNSWYDHYPSLYSIHDLVPAIGQIVVNLAPNVVLAQPTPAIAAENNDRRLLSGLEYVDTSSPIFDRRTIRPAEWILRCSFSGAGTVKATDAGIRLGNTQVRVETRGGTSTAIARYELIRRRDFVTVGVVTAKDVYSSTNITGLSASQFGFLSRGQSLAYEQSSDDETRRDILSTSGCLNKKSPLQLARLLGKVR